MAAYGLREAAHRAGLTDARFAEFVSVGAVSPSDEGAFSEGDVRRALCVAAFIDAGVPLEVLVRALQSGALTLHFLDDPVYERLAATSNETFAEAADRTGIALELLGVIREALGSQPPAPDDYVRETELAVVPYLEAARDAGYSVDAIESMLRVAGDGMRRIAETEGRLFYLEILEPRLAQGLTGGDLVPELAASLAIETDASLSAIHHGQQAHSWMRNVVNATASQLANAGFYERSERQPAICFLDVTGYTRLTQERGDVAAAELAERLARVVQRGSTGRGGKPVKWLGDGVMFYFDEAAGAVVAALEMVAAIREAGLPSAHVGVVSGDVVFQQGDYFGQTVNLAARIADYARPGEVLVSAETVVAAAGVEGVRFDEIGPVELKGVDGAVVLFVARRDQ